MVRQRCTCCACCRGRGGPCACCGVRPNCGRRAQARIPGGQACSCTEACGACGGEGDRGGEGKPQADQEGRSSRASHSYPRRCRLRGRPCHCTHQQAAPLDEEQAEDDEQAHALEEAPARPQGPPFGAHKPCSFRGRPCHSYPAARWSVNVPRRRSGPRTGEAQELAQAQPCRRRADAHVRPLCREAPQGLAQGRRGGSACSGRRRTC
mmetsp:Transcript_12282/g.49281  ORF Transcript_12282/g.49281 Transcript_12282/m.49281 type:complete len:208 (+) Transcript_12282:188-811(+)